MLIVSFLIVIIIILYFSAPRVQHLLRCSPSANNAALQTFDKHLRVAVTSITNSDRENFEICPHKTGVFARESCLFGLSGKHPLSPGSNVGIESLLHGPIPGLFICHAGPLQLGHFQLHCPVNNPSGRSWDSKMTVHLSRILLQNRHRRLQ